MNISTQRKLFKSSMYFMYLMVLLADFGFCAAMGWVYYAIHNNILPANLGVILMALALWSWSTVGWFNSISPYWVKKYFVNVEIMAQEIK